MGRLRSQHGQSNPGAGLSGRLLNRPPRSPSLPLEVRPYPPPTPRGSLPRNPSLRPFAETRPIPQARSHLRKPSLRPQSVSPPSVSTNSQCSRAE